MPFVRLEDLSNPSKVAILKLCVGNIIFVVFGIIAVSFGGYYINRDNVTKFMATYIEGASSADVDGLLDEGNAQFILAICIILIATGVGITIVSFVGFCGAVQRNSSCLVGYMVFLVILILAESTALALFGTFKTKIDTTVADYLKTNVLSKNYMFGKGTHNGLTAAFDYIQMEYKCCGVLGATDYQSEFENWKSEYVVDGQRMTIAVPPFCCKFKEDKRLTWKQILSIESNKNLTLRRIKQVFQPYWKYDDCLDYEDPNSQSVWTNKGCFRSFQGEIFKNLFQVLVGITVAVVVFEILCLLSSCILTCDISVVVKEEAMADEQAAALKAERDTIMAGMHNNSSMGAFSMTGNLQPHGSIFHQPMASMMGAGHRSMMSQQSVGMGGMAYTPSRQQTPLMY